MASLVVQDQNLNVHFNGVSVEKPNVLKSQRNRGLGTRKPLGDLSNAAAPASTMVSKKENSKDMYGASKKKNTVSKTEEKKAPKTGRKALSDISNSSKPRSHHVSKNQNLKLSVLPEESIADERFLHNHSECVKTQMKAMDMDEFLQTIGLDSGHHKLITSPLPSKSRFESSWNYWELDEMDEPELEDPFTLRTEFSDNLLSPPPCRTPKSATASHFASHFDFVMTGTPTLLKH